MAGESSAPTPERTPPLAPVVADVIAALHLACDRIEALEAEVRSLTRQQERLTEGALADEVAGRIGALLEAQAQDRARTRARRRRAAIAQTGGAGDPP